MGGDPQADEATLLRAVRAGDPTAFPALFERSFAHARDLAESVLSDRDDISKAVVAGYRHAWETLPGIAAGSFGAAVGLATRTDALARLDAGAAPVVPATRTSWFRARPGATAEDRLAASSAVKKTANDSEIADLVRAASLVLGPADRSLLVLQLRLGVSEQEIAAASGDDVHDVEQRLFRLRARLRAAVEAIVLWRGGRPVCDDLARVVRQMSKGRFDSETAAAITDHAEACARCGHNKRLQITPAVLFAEIPLADDDPQLHDEVAASLSTSGVPVIAPEPEPEVVPNGAGSPGPATAGGAAVDAAKGRSPLRRGQIGALVGGAIVALALLLLGLQPWESSGAPHFGVLGSSSVTTSPPTRRATTTTSSPTRSAGGTTTTTPTTSAPSLSAPPATNSTTTTSPTTHAPSTSRAPTTPAFAAASVAGGGVCADGTSTAVTLSWQARNATSVAIQGSSTNAIDKPASGQLAVCVPALPATFTLTAHGPGGTVSETLTVNSSGRPTTSTSSTTTSTTTPAPSVTTGGSAVVPDTVTPGTGG